MTKGKRRSYDPGFKRNAVLLSEDPSRAHSEVAHSLGISHNILYRWRREYYHDGRTTFSGQRNELLTDDKCRIKELEKKAAQRRNRAGHPKKALAIFSSAPK